MFRTSAGRSSVTAYRKRMLATYILMLDALRPALVEHQQELPDFLACPSPPGERMKCRTNRRARTTGSSSACAVNTDGA